MKDNEGTVNLKSVYEEYKEAVTLSDDEELLVSTNLKLLRIFDLMGDVQVQFVDGEITAYEALTRTTALLDLAAEINKQIKDKI